MKWATLDTNGHLEVRQGKPSLRDLQQVVGGLIEAFPLNDGSSIILNDEGKFAEVVVNNLAATMAAQEIGPGLFPGDFIAGNVAFIGPADDEGETTDLPDNTLDVIRAINERAIAIIEGI